MSRLSGKKIIVTGGSGGIGQAIVVEFVKQGADVVFGYRTDVRGANKTIKIAKTWKGSAVALKANLADNSQIFSFIEDGCNILKGVDVLVNSAGIIVTHTDFMSIATSSIEQVMAVNFVAPFILTQEVSKVMKRQGTGGSIINISSMSTRFLTSGSTHYECSKSALEALTRGAASSLGVDNIRVNCISPGSIATSINERQRLKDPKGWDRRKTFLPLNREGFPEDIANICTFLASDSSLWITGATIPVDGGASLINPFLVL